MSTIADALVSLGVSGYSLIGEPTTEEEFKAAFTGTTDKTWAEIKAEKERIAYVAKRKAEYRLRARSGNVVTWIAGVAMVIGRPRISSLARLAC